MNKLNDDFSSLAPEELEDELLNLGQQKDAIRERMRQLVEIRDERVAQKSAQLKLDSMSDAERRILGIPERQMVSASGIDSEEKVSDLE